jgi:RNA polymerase sigma-70 factor (ECF subfamily)
MATHPQDLQQARRIASGDRAAFDAFFELTFPRLYRFVLLRAQRNEDATQDLCQQTLERAMRHMSTYRGEASLFTWVCQIARREIADYWERQGQDARRNVSYDQDIALRQVLESLEYDATKSPEGQGELRDLQLLVQSVLDHLPSPYGDVLEWKYVEGMDAEEIGTRLRLSSTAAHSLVARARRAFRSEYEALAQELG